MTPHAEDTEVWISYLRDVDPQTYLDVGAGDGFDCAEVKKAFPECRCIAIEPYEAWEVDGGIEKQRDVIGHSDSWTLFHVKTNPGVHGIYSRLALPTVDVLARPLHTLTHFCKRENVAVVDAIKIDVEGAAWDVIAGAQEVFRKVRAVHVETEWLHLFDGQRQESEVFMLLHDCGLTKVWENRVEELGQGDSIWVRK